jgi:tetratricopeptide (TPR) repeat protein
MGFAGTRSALASATFVASVACVVALAPDVHAQRRPAPKGNRDVTPAPTASPVAVAASNRARAAELFKKSDGAYLHGDFAAAIALLDEAYALDPQPVLLYNKARAHEGLGHVDEAIELYEKYLAEEPSSADRGAIEQRLVTLKKQRDEKLALAKERTQVEQDRAAVDKERANAPSAEPPPEPPRRRSALPYVVMGAGGVSLVGGAVFGLLANSKKSAAQSEPVQTQASDLRDKGRTFATVSNVTFVVGGVLVAAGAVWWVLDGQSSKRSVRVGFGPGSLQLGGEL